MMLHGRRVYVAKKGKWVKRPPGVQNDEMTMLLSGRSSLDRVCAAEALRDRTEGGVETEAERMRTYLEFLLASFTFPWDGQKEQIAIRETTWSMSQIGSQIGLGSG
jgi:hypothetical protein